MRLELDISHRIPIEEEDCYRLLAVGHYCNRCAAVIGLVVRCRNWHCRPFEVRQYRLASFQSV